MKMKVDPAQATAGWPEIRAFVLCRSWGLVPPNTSATELPGGFGASGDMSTRDARPQALRSTHVRACLGIGQRIAQFNERTVPTAGIW